MFLLFWHSRKFGTYCNGHYEIRKKHIYLYTNKCSFLSSFFILFKKWRDFHNMLDFPWTVTVSSKTYFLCYTFSLCRFSWSMFQGVSHTHAYKSRLLILYHNSSWHHFLAERNGKDFFAVVSHWKPNRIFFSALLTLNVWLETHLYMPATKLSLPILPEPSKKQYRLPRCAIHNTFLLLTTHAQKPSPLLGAPLGMEASKSLQGLRSADLSTQVGNHKPGVSYLATDPCLPSCLSLQQKLHVKMPLAAALV